MFPYVRHMNTYSPGLHLYNLKLRKDPPVMLHNLWEDLFLSALHLRATQQTAGERIQSPKSDPDLTWSNLFQIRIRAKVYSNETKINLQF